MVRERWQRTYELGDDEGNLDPGRTFRPPPLPGAEALTVRGGADLALSAQRRGTSAALPAPTLGFALTEVLGEGGMGVVYRARQPQLRREVAVKKVRRDAMSDAARESFLSEAYVTAALDHPNIVPVHDLKETALGEIELAMKIVGGHSWKDLLHPRTPEHRERAAKVDLNGHLDTLLSVCNAVAFAHSRGIAHLDLKPENVMAGEFGEVLLMDWGIAADIRLHPSDSPRARHKLQISSPCGTPSYMAPELAEGDGAGIGPWTDVYLLGAILHELLAGRPPHAKGGGFYAALFSAAKSTPPNFDESVPTELGTICRKAMSREPRGRFSTVVELYSAVEGYLSHRESLLVSERAKETLRRCRMGLSSSMVELESKEGERNRLYEQFADAISGFKQARLLWVENPEALAGEDEARLDYARAALRFGDLGLASSQAAALREDHAQTEILRIDLRKAQRELDRHSARVGRMRLALWIGALLFAISAAIALGFILREKAKAEQSAKEARANANRAEVNATEARANAKEARRSLAEIRRVADAVPARSLQEEIDSLWPERSNQVPKLESWLSATSKLLGRQESHEAALAELSSAGLDKGERQDDRARRLKTLGGVVAELKKLRARVPELERRLDIARGMRARTLEGGAARAWERAIRSIANRSECPAYGGLNLKPIEGLVPLSRNVRTGLWEFWHVQSGEQPQKEGVRWLVKESTGMVFILIPAGQYLMGSDDGRPEERPIHQVSVRPFLISKYELTQGQWTRMMGVNPSEYGPGKLGATLAHPVEQVSWRDGSELSKRLGLRLPSEAEWEYAARAGTKTEWWTGAAKSSLRGAANLADQTLRQRGASGKIEAWNDGHTVHAPVGSFRGNQWGLFDTAGNVWEWCQDDWIDNYRSGPNNHLPRGDGSAADRISRGGSWRHEADFLRSAYRYRFEPEYRFNYLGLRLAGDVD